MPTLRALRTLNEIEAGTLSGTNFETRLGSPGHLAEFSSLLTTRSQTRRMASNNASMAAISVSIRAHIAIFKSAIDTNTSLVEALVNNPNAMELIAGEIRCLNAITDNATSFRIFRTSPHFEANILGIVSLLAGININDHSDMTSLLNSSTATAKVAASDRAMKAIVESPSTMAIAVNISTAVSDMTGDASAFKIMARSDSTMNLIAQSSVAMSLVSTANRATVVSIPSALKIFASYDDVWANLMETSATIDNTIYRVVTTLADIDRTLFDTMTSIFKNATETEKVASSTASLIAILNDPTTLDLLINSPNLLGVYDNPNALEIFSTYKTTLVDLIGNETAFSVMLKSVSAKGKIFNSPSLLSTMLTEGSSSQATVLSAAVNATGPIPDAKIGAYQSLGIPGNIIILTAKIGSITAAQVDNTFIGDTQPAATFPCPGTSATSVYPVINLPFTNVIWDINSIAATAAAKITITYVDFN
jgi:hypothetical protein